MDEYATDLRRRKNAAWANLGCSLVVMAVSWVFWWPLLLVVWNYWFEQ